MSLFGQVFRTVVNVVTLPVTVPVAVAEDAGDFIAGNSADNLKKVIDRLKREAEE